MTKTYTTQAIAEALEGDLIGDGSIVIARVAHPSTVLDDHDILLAMDKKIIPLLTKSPARAAVISPTVEIPKGLVEACIVVKRPRLALAKITSLFAPTIQHTLGVHPTAVVEKSAKLGKNVSIGAQCYVGHETVIGDGCILLPQVYLGDKVSLGPDALIYPGVKIGSFVTLGAHAIVHFNASIGADGFSFVTPQLGSVEAVKESGESTVTATNEKLVRIASLAAVIVGDDVEIGANTSIDRGTIVSTRIGNGTKIDNQVQIGHNVVVGDDCLICGRVGIAGSSVVGNRVVLGGAVGIADHVTVGDDVVAMAMSGIAGNVPPRSVIGGIPAVSRDRLMENLFNLNRIKQFTKKLEVLTSRLDTLENSKKND